MNRTRLRTAVLVALAVVAVPALRARAQDVAPMGAPEPETLPPVWDWVQIASAPRFGSSLTSIAVDPHLPSRMFVGTEDGTVLRSTDGGVTWEEVQLSPFLRPPRSLGIRDPLNLPPQPYIPILFETLNRPPFSEIVGLVQVPFDSLVFAVKPEFQVIILRPTPLPSQDILLYDVWAGRRNVETERVTSIALCPNATYPIIVATDRNVYGSTEDGERYERIFSLPRPAFLYTVNVSLSTREERGRNIRRVVCSPTNSNFVVLATGYGLWFSRDGGVTFEEHVTDAPAQDISTVAFGRPAGAEGRDTLLVGTGAGLVAGDLSSAEGLQPVYMPGAVEGSPEVRPGNINWISTAPSGRIWIATSNDLLTSEDGDHWAVAGRFLFSGSRRLSAYQVLVGSNDDGGERVAVVTREWVYTTDDNGVSWHPFFHGLTRRGFRQMASAPPSPGQPAKWWVVTGGEVFSSVPAEPEPAYADQDTQRWARAEITRTPSLDAVIDEVTRRQRFLPEWLDRTQQLTRRGTLVPVLSAHVDLIMREFDRAATVRMTETRDHFEERSNWDWRAFVQLEWWFWDLQMSPTLEIWPPRNGLYAIRREALFLVEDAWHERLLHLRRLARGIDDALQIETLRARIDTLEALIEVWLRRPLASLFSEQRQRRTQ